MKIMTPMGCLTGLGVIFPGGWWGGPTHVVVSNIKMALGFNFCF